MKILIIGAAGMIGRKITEALAARYPVRRFHRHEPDGGLGLLSRWPLLRQELRPSPVGAFPAW